MHYRCSFAFWSIFLVAQASSRQFAAGNHVQHTCMQYVNSLVNADMVSNRPVSVLSTGLDIKALKKCITDLLSGWDCSSSRSIYQTEKRVLVCMHQAPKQHQPNKRFLCASLAQSKLVPDTHMYIVLAA